MMYVIVKNPNGSKQEYSWHINEPVKTLYELAEFTVEVQADGDELEYIRINFDNLPMAFEPTSKVGVLPGWQVKRIIRWFGSDAQFIAGNL